MIFDGNSLPEAAQLDADLCIIGAGVAGLAIAYQLLSSRGKIILLESGDTKPEAAIQELYKEAANGCAYQDPRQTRQRQLTGTAAIWNTRVENESGAKFIPLDPLDLAKRDWVPNSGWPLEPTVITDALARAHQLLGLGPVAYDSDSWDTHDAAAWNLAGGKICSGVYQVKTGKLFQETIPNLIRESQNVNIYTRSSVTNIVPVPAGESISHVEVKTLEGKKFSVKARQFILASGGHENPRILLASNSVWPAGVGNQHDVVGRYLQDHPYRSTFATLVPTQQSLLQTSAFYDLHQVRGTWIVGRLAVRQEVQAQEKIMNASMVLIPRLRGYRSKGVEAFRQARLMMRGRRSKKGLISQSFKALFHAGDLFAYRKLEKRVPNPDLHHWSKRDTACYATFEPEIYFEQAPERENRITLSEEKDALGIPRSIYKWKWSDLDEKSSRRNMQIFAEEFARLGIGRMDPLPHAERVTWGGHHHLGTTRMSKDPKLGVVDADCRVHGLSNLFIAGSSVFPAGGFANPTLMILALALRLADKVADQWTSTPISSTVMDKSLLVDK
jgi:choline dehydrogenase-like flavoprotein